MAFTEILRGSGTIVGEFNPEIARLMFGALTSEKFFDKLRISFARIEEGRGFPIWAPKSSVGGSLDFGDLNGLTVKTSSIAEEITAGLKFERGTRLLAFVSVKDTQDSPLRPTIGDLVSLGVMNDRSPTYGNTTLVLARKRDENLELLLLRERTVLKGRLDKRNKREAFERSFVGVSEEKAKKILDKMKEFYRVLPLTLLWKQTPELSAEQIQAIIDFA